MKKLLLFVVLFNTGSLLLYAQGKSTYPNPEFNNEISFLNKENMTLVRLEKETSKLKSKTKMGGMGGGESGYTLDLTRSPVRLPGGNNFSFVFYTANSLHPPSPATDSMMKAHGMDASMTSQITSGMEMMNDPSKKISLYDMNVENGMRKITIQAYQGMKLLGKSKKESTKYTLSIKKINEGYYEMIVDKPLPKGEYAFTLMDYGSTDGSYLLFAFGID
jgi:hypothetical protein